MNGNTVSVIGLGYIGLPTATLLARGKVRVIGVDAAQSVVDSVNAGKLHIVEPGLDTILKDVVLHGYLRAATQAEPADAFIIAVPTPFRENHKPNLSHIRSAAASIAPVLKKGDLVILESTSPVGATEDLARRLAGARPDLRFPHQAGEDADVLMAYCPERVLPGNILHELVANDRVVGGMSAASSRRATALYRIFVQGDIIATDARTAELCKLTENSFRDVNIAFANELSMICDKLNIDVRDVIRLANRHPRVNILQPGCGVGGHCIAVDPWFIVDGAPEQARLIRVAREVNDRKPRWVLEKIRDKIDEVLAADPEKRLEDVTVACLGLAFKPDIDDLRESPAVEIAGDIAELGCKVLAVEPNTDALPQALAARGAQIVSLAHALERADVVAILVWHSQFLAAAENIAACGRVVTAAGTKNGLQIEGSGLYERGGIKGSEN